MAFFKLEGYILAQKSDDDDEESEEEVETVPEFLDMNEMDAVSSGAFQFQRSVPAWDEGMTFSTTIFIFFIFLFRPDTYVAKINNNVLVGAVLIPLYTEEKLINAWSLDKFN